MPTSYPKSVSDLALAPVLIAIEQNVARLRASVDLELEMELDLSDSCTLYRTADQRADRVIRAALRDVDLHGWDVAPSADHHGIVVAHRDYQVTLMLGARLLDYVEYGILS